MIKKFIASVLILAFLLVGAYTVGATTTQIGYNKITITGIIDEADYLSLEKIFNASRNKTKWTIEITSPGGMASYGIAMYQLIREQVVNGVEIITVIRSEADSAGAILFMAGSKRIMYEGSQIMIHKSYLIDNRTGEKFTPKPDSDIEKALKNTNDFLIKLLAKILNKNMTEAAEFIKKDWRLNAKEATANGIATDYINLLL